MADELDALITLAYVDAELEKNANFIGRGIARVKGFTQGWQGAKQFQKQQQNVQSAYKTLGHAVPEGSQYAGNAPTSMFGRMYDRYQGGKQRAGLEAELYTARKTQDKQTRAADVLRQHGEAVPERAGPDYHKMDAAGLHQYKTNPEAWQANQAAAGAGAAQGQAAPHNAPNRSWYRPAAYAAGGLALAGGAYMLGRGQQQGQGYPPSYGPPGYPPYGRYAYAEYEELATDKGQEKTALIGALGHLVGGGLVGHVGANVIGRQSHHHSNIHEVLAHRAFQAGLQGKILHPTRQRALEMTLGAEALNAWRAAHAAGKQMAGLSPTGQRVAMEGLLKGQDVAGLSSNTPFLGPTLTAIQHHIAGTAPSLSATGMTAKVHSRVLDDLTQHIIDPGQKQNIIQRGLGHLRGALPALGLGAIDVGLGGGGIGAIGHLGINKLRKDVAESRLGKNVAKEQLHAGLTAQDVSKGKRLAGEVLLSPAFFDPMDMGRYVGSTPLGLPAVLLSADEKAKRHQKMMNEPVMQSALRHRAPAATTAVGGALAPQSAQQAQQTAPTTAGSGIGRYAAPAIGAAALGGLGLTAYRAGQAANEQEARMNDYMTNARHNASTPLPPLTVKASYDQFYEEKCANVYSPVYPSMHSAMATSVAQQLANKFVAEPIDAAHKALTKKLYDEPKQRAAFEEAIQSDEMLQEAHRSNPRALEETFSTLRTFAPSIAKNPSATKSFLRQATMSGMHGGGPDFATIRLMAETEKFIQNSKGRGVNQ